MRKPKLSPEAESEWKDFAQRADWSAIPHLDDAFLHFVLGVHRRRESLLMEDIRDMLNDEPDCPEEMADRLAQIYRFGWDLLEAAEREAKT